MHHPRYALLSGRHALALCEDVDGLYGEPAPPPRAVHEIRGCEPRGELARAVTEAVVEGTAPLGTLLVRTHDGLVWRFEDCRVLGARGDVVTVESTGGPRRSYGSPTGDTGDTGHTGAAGADTEAAGADTEDPVVPCGNIVPVSPSPRETRTHTEVTFLGCSPRGGLRDALAAGAEEYGAVRYQVLDHLGGSHHEAEAGRVTGWDTSVRRRGLTDLTVAFPCAGLIPHPTREVWELWHRDRPAEPGTWRRFTGAARAEWLRQAVRRSYDVPEIEPGATYHLDGTEAVDEDALRCALGEAVHGPGRTLGAGTPRALGLLLADTTLVWHRSDVSRACLGVQPWNGPRPATFQEYADGLRAAGVRLVLE
ncbi:hypothetical protein ACIRQY_06165 [Streptomyces sp. NPDC101490]|uniref:hypothetical protein n=1 Tax=Streptomyces sp. NPDC101490 TaxID=3366143 RepID=UPI00381FA023